MMGFGPRLRFLRREEEFSQSTSCRDLPECGRNSLLPFVASIASGSVRVRGSRPDGRLGNGGNRSNIYGVAIDSIQSTSTSIKLWLCVIGGKKR